ncbi:MAG: cob(I)yrinic acid a,c-diamide adenosyltransferase [Balneolales bacterium]
MKIYTKTGDTGETSLFGGQRVSKTNVRIEACGQVDELNSTLGLARSFHPTKVNETLLQRLQNELFVLGADLATPPSRETKIERINEAHITFLESQIDALQEELQPLQFFILPGGTSAASTLHLSRTVCRRAERACIHCAETEDINNDAVIYLNRLSDLLFVMTRYENKNAGILESRWKVR